MQSGDRIMLTYVLRRCFFRPRSSQDIECSISLSGKEGGRMCYVLVGA